MRNTIAAVIAAMSMLAPGALARRVIDPASPQVVQWFGRRRGSSAKSPGSAARGKCEGRRRLRLAYGPGSKTFFDSQVMDGLRAGVRFPQRRVLAIHREWLAAGNRWVGKAA